jgi:SAM-dependent methyltransferase
VTEQKFVAAPANGASAESEDIDVRIDEDVTDPTPPVSAVPAAVSIAEPVTARDEDGAPSTRDPMVEAESTKTRRARPKKMSLRIPDDEVARPSERIPTSVKPADEAVPVSEPRPAIAPSRIIAINPPSERQSNRASQPDIAPDPPTAVRLDQAPDIHDAPTHVELSDDDVPDPSGDRLTPDPITTPSTKLAAASASDLAWEISKPSLPSEPSVSKPAVAALPSLVSEDLDPEDRTQEIAPSPHAEKTAADLSDDGVDVQVDADDSVPDRLSELPEIGADDLVSVESMPVIQKKRSVPPAAPPIPALAYQSGEHTAQTPNGAAAVIEAASHAPVVIVPPTAPTSAPAVATSVPPLNDTAKKRVRTWWEELFNDDFVRTMAKITDKQISREANFIEESLGVAKGSALLDLGCGTGLHAIELTKRGYQVIGFDLSLPMLARAADEAQERNQKINFVQGDMRDLPFEEMFDGVYSWNTSFGYFDEEKNGQVITKVHRALKKGGQFLLDVVNRDYIIKQSPSLAWFEGDGCICMDEMQIDFITSRMRIKRTMMMDDGRSREIEYSMRIYSLHELGKLLHEHGFRVAEVSGRMATPGVFFGNESPRTLILAEKR